MSRDPSVRPPRFLDEQRSDPRPSAVAFARLSSPRSAAPVVPPRTALSPVPRPPPTPPGPSAEPGLPQEAPTPAPSVSPPPPVLAGMMVPPPSVPSPFAVDASTRLAAAVERLKLEASRLADQARADALEIGFQVARRILEQELSSSPEALFSLVRSAVRRVGDARRLVIRLHPGDVERVGSQEGRQRLGLSLMQVEVVADPALGAGDCVIESEQATVDGRLATRLDEVRRGVESALAGEEP
ncbi:MAG: flagellar assembly protein FliH [Myxococcales bacterium]|nr:flagellar assembly protein FliH [Myxococcales bacterium]